MSEYTVKILVYDFSKLCVCDSSVIDKTDSELVAKEKFDSIHYIEDIEYLNDKYYPKGTYFEVRLSKGGLIVESKLVNKKEGSN